MNELNRFFQSLERKYSQELHTAIVSEVLRYDPTKLQADVQPLSNVRGEALPPILNLPLAYTGNATFIMHAPLTVGDLVLVIFSEHDIDTILEGIKTTNTMTQRTHDLDDAIIVGKIDPFTSVTTLSATDLYIGTRDGTAGITIQPDGTIIIESGTVKLGKNATHGLALGDMIKTVFDGHTHNYSWSDSGGSGTTSGPGTSFPNPSTKVVTE